MTLFKTQSRHAYACAVDQFENFRDNQGTTPMTSEERNELMRLTHVITQRVRVPVHNLIVEGEVIGTYRSLNEAHSERTRFKRAGLKSRVETKYKLVAI